MTAFWLAADDVVELEKLVVFCRSRTVIAVMTN